MSGKKLEQFLSEGEGQSVEFKESLRLLNEIGECISAFSNSNNAVILVGVSDNGKVVGASIGRNSLEELAGFIKRNTDPPVFPRITIERVRGKKVVVVSVGECSEKPVLFKGRGFKRVGKTNQKLSASEIRKLAKESGERVYWDERICREAGLKGIDEEKVKWFLRKAKHERNFGVEPETPVEEALERLDLTKSGKLTNAAVLLFGKNPQKFFLQAETKCARFKGTEPLEFIDMKAFSGSIIDQRENAIGFVKEHIKLHAKIVGTERVEEWEYPIEAIREAITNAVCHRGYETTGNVQIRIFDDRIEIWGCGPLPKPLTVEDLKKKHKSIPRNPLIAKCFFLIKFIEEWGTGTNRIIKWCLEKGLPEPVFEEIANNLVVIFRKYKITEEILKELNERQKRIVEYLKAHEKISRSECMKLLNTSKDTAFRELLALQKKNILTRQGSGKNVYYELK